MNREYKLKQLHFALHLMMREEAAHADQFDLYPYSIQRCSAGYKVVCGPVSTPIIAYDSRAGVVAIQLGSNAHFMPDTFESLKLAAEFCSQFGVSFVRLPSDGFFRFLEHGIVGVTAAKLGAE